MMMMTEKTNCQHLALLCISFLLFCFPGSTTCKDNPPAVDPAVEQICQQTSFPSVCNSALTPFSPQTNNTATAILEMALNATLNLTKAALAEATRQLNETSFSDYGEIGIESCQQYYNWAVEDLQKADQAVVDGDEELFSSSVKEAIRMYWGCERANTDWDMYGELYYILGYALPINHSPFKDTDWQLAQMGINCLDFSRAVSWPSS